MGHVHIIQKSKLFQWIEYQNTFYIFDINFVHYISFVRIVNGLEFC